MIQLVASSRPPGTGALGSHCLVNPDRLLELARDFKAGGTSEALVDEFSYTLHDLRMGGSYKRTNRGRLGETVRMLLAHVEPKLRDGFILLDVGASDGVTTVEAVRALREGFGTDIQAILADVNLWLLRYRKGNIVEYRATNGEPIMVRLGPFGVRLARHRFNIDTIANPIEAYYLKRTDFRKAMRLDERILLVNPLAQAEPGVRVMELDCLALSPDLMNRVTAVRASNVLNLDYFAGPQIECAIGHLHAYLVQDGCLVVSRNSDGTSGEVENGSVWLKDERRFAWIEDFGAGSEVKAIVDGWRAP